eukprot:TRINITY_DN749_c0_g1_i3.p2 TRINITY_DN749_c0_g1~~TRINITY_DN749_c0_g1_i3.p2  ORF type:complete len:181 (-),score=60.56 TRINITY_DN749_c0_g1_i3:205-747(-)
MPATGAGAGDGWVASTVAGREALVFKPDKLSTGIDGAGEVGVKEYTFKVDTAGAYRVMMRLNAPHPTDHNDLWMKLGAGARMYQGSTVLTLTSGWFKVYQNRGKDEWMFGGLTVDFDGHGLLTRPLAAGETFTVSISGRSSRLAVADVYLLVCDPTWSACGGGWPYYETAVGMGVSSCVA